MQSEEAGFGATPLPRWPQESPTQLPIAWLPDASNIPAISFLYTLTVCAASRFTHSPRLAIKPRSFPPFTAGLQGQAECGNAFPFLCPDYLPFEGLFACLQTRISWFPCPTGHPGR